MNFKMGDAIEILERTPLTLECFLSGRKEHLNKSCLNLKRLEPRIYPNLRRSWILNCNWN